MKIRQLIALNELGLIPQDLRWTGGDISTYIKGYLRFRQMLLYWLIAFFVGFMILAVYYPDFPKPILLFVIVIIITMATGLISTVLAIFTLIAFVDLWECAKDLRGLLKLLSLEPRRFVEYDTLKLADAAGWVLWRKGQNIEFAERENGRTSEKAQAARLEFRRAHETFLGFILVDPKDNGYFPANSPGGPIVYIEATI